MDLWDDTEEILDEYEEPLTWKEMLAMAVIIVVVSMAFWGAIGLVVHAMVG